MLLQLQALGMTGSAAGTHVAATLQPLDCSLWQQMSLPRQTLTSFAT